MAESFPAVFNPIASEIRLVHARLNRADEHVRMFQETWDEYLSTRPHKLQHTPESDGTLTVRLHRTSPLPVELSVTFGELLYELRAALDNCLYAIAVLVSGENPPPSAGRLEWPIRETPAEWKSQASRYRDLPPVIREALEPCVSCSAPASTRPQPERSTGQRCGCRNTTWSTQVSVATSRSRMHQTRKLRAAFLSLAWSPFTADR